MPAFDEAFANVLGTLSLAQARRAQTQQEKNRLDLFQQAQQHDWGRETPLGVLTKQWDKQMKELQAQSDELDQKKADEEAMKKQFGADWMARLKAGFLKQQFPDIFGPLGADEGQQAATEQTMPVPATSAGDVRSALFDMAPESMGFPQGFMQAAGRLPNIGPTADQAPQDWSAMQNALASGFSPESLTGGAPGAAAPSGLDDPLARLAAVGVPGGLAAGAALRGMAGAIGDTAVGAAGPMALDAGEISMMSRLGMLGRFASRAAPWLAEPFLLHDLLTTPGRLNQIAQRAAADPNTFKNGNEVHLPTGHILKRDPKTGKVTIRLPERVK